MVAPETPAPATPAVASAQSIEKPKSDWMDRISFHGDFRGRVESFWIKNKRDRNRLRYRLRFGAKADITIFELGGSHLYQLVDPIQTMILNGTGRDFSTVIVNGRVVMRDWKIPGVDLDDMHTRAQELFDKIRASYPKWTHLHPPAHKLFNPTYLIRSRT